MKYTDELENCEANFLGSFGKGRFSWLPASHTQWSTSTHTVSNIDSHLGYRGHRDRRGEPNRHGTGLPWIQALTRTLVIMREAWPFPGREVLWVVTSGNALEKPCPWNWILKVRTRKLNVRKGWPWQLFLMVSEACAKEPEPWRCVSAAR